MPADPDYPDNPSQQTRWAEDREHGAPDYQGQEGDVLAEALCLNCGSPRSHVRHGPSRGDHLFLAPDPGFGPVVRANRRRARDTAELERLTPDPGAAPEVHVVAYTDSFGNPATDTHFHPGAAPERPPVTSLREQQLWQAGFDAGRADASAPSMELVAADPGAAPEVDKLAAVREYVFASLTMNELDRHRLLLFIDGTEPALRDTAPALDAPEVAMALIDARPALRAWVLAEGTTNEKEAGLEAVRALRSALEGASRDT